MTFLPSQDSCALPRRELWQVLGRFAGIGRVVSSREGGNVAVEVVVAWMCVWKLWERGWFYTEGLASGVKSAKMREHFPDFGARGKNRPRTCCMLLLVVPWCGAGSVKALRGARDRLCRLEGLLESVGLGTYPICW